MWAGQNGDLKVVKTLIDNGANIHAVDVDGKTALMWAEKQQPKPATQRILIEIFIRIPKPCKFSDQKR